jgi:hypothetical protein
MLSSVGARREDVHLLIQKDGKMDCMSIWISDAARVGSRHVQLFVPAVDRDGGPVPRGQKYWVQECLTVMGSQFGGATAFPPSQGVWRDDEHGGRLVYEETVIVFSYVSDEDLNGAAGRVLLEFINRLGRDGNQGEVGVFVDGTYYGFQSFETSSEAPNAMEEVQ